MVSLYDLMKTQKTLVLGNEKETQRNTGTDGKT